MHCGYSRLKTKVSCPRCAAIGAVNMVPFSLLLTFCHIIMLWTKFNYRDYTQLFFDRLDIEDICYVLTGYSLQLLHATVDCCEDALN